MNAATAALLMNWRKLTTADLEARVDEIQRAAVEQHLEDKDWRTLDRMRAELKARGRQTQTPVVADDSKPSVPVQLLSKSIADHTLAIHQLRKRVAGDILEIGRRLVAVRDDPEMKNWLGWLDEEFGWSDQTAYHFIHVYEAQRDPGFQKIWNSDLPLSSIYRLAAPKTPEAAREEIVERLEAGEKLSGAQVAEVITEAKAGKKPAEESAAPEDLSIPGFLKRGPSSEPETKNDKPSSEPQPIETSNDDDDPAAARKAFYAAQETLESTTGEERDDRHSVPTVAEAANIAYDQIPPEPAGATVDDAPAEAGEPAVNPEGTDPTSAPAPKPTILDLWRAADSKERLAGLAKILEGVEIQELVEILPAHLRRGLETRLLKLKGLQRSDQLSKLLKTALSSRSPDEQIAALGRMKTALAKDKLSSGDVQERVVRVSK